MGIMSDVEIKERCVDWQSCPGATGPMLTPFEPCLHRPGVISYGVSSYGYDFRLAPEFKIFDETKSEAVVDPKNFDESCFRVVEEDHVIIPPNSFVLARTIEKFDIPRDVMVVCVGKSTYARCGLIVNVTPFEPGWKGYATIEISNTTRMPAKIYANEGIAQALFFQASVDTLSIRDDLLSLQEGLGVPLSGHPSEYRNVCETSYADKKGKYQDQVGIVSAKVLK